MELVELTTWNGMRLTCDVMSMERVEEDVTGCHVIISGHEYRVKDSYGCVIDKWATAMRKIVNSHKKNIAVEVR